MKRAIAFIVIAAFVLALIPFQTAYLDDGGSVEYRALLYSVMKYHRLATQPDAQQIDGFDVGWRVEVLGTTVYDKTEFEAVK